MVLPAQNLWDLGERRQSCPHRLDFVRRAGYPSLPSTNSPPLPCSAAIPCTNNGSRTHQTTSVNIYIALSAPHVRPWWNGCDEHRYYLHCAEQPGKNSGGGELIVPLGFLCDICYPAETWHCSKFGAAILAAYLHLTSHHYILIKIHNSYLLKLIIMQYICWRWWIANQLKHFNSMQCCKGWC